VGEIPDSRAFPKEEGFLNAIPNESGSIGNQCSEENGEHPAKELDWVMPWGYHRLRNSQPRLHRYNPENKCYYHNSRSVLK
jgi:hypothetical protein